MERDAIDLGKLGVFRLFRMYFVPTLLGMLAMAAVTAFDGIFVGHGVGSDGIAAINLLIPVMMVFNGLGIMIGAGCSVVASIQLSRGKEKVARINVTQAMMFATILTIIPSAAMVLFPETTLRLLGSSDALMPMAKDYLLWYVPAWVFQIWSAIALYVIRLDGAPKLAMGCTVISAAINFVLDWLFIFPLGWGVMGAAFATAISVAVGGLIAMAYLLFYARTLRLCRLKISSKSLRLFCRNIGYQCRIGSSGLLTEATLATFMFMGNQVFMHYLGEDGVGAFGIACYYVPFVFMVGNAVAQSAQPIISYNFGLGNMRRVNSAERVALATAVTCGLVVTLLFALCPEMLVSLFLNDGGNAANIATFGLPYFSASFIFFVINLTVIGYYQSIESAKPATTFALLRGFVFLIPSFLLLPSMIGESGMWLALACSEVLTSLAIVIFFAMRKKSKFYYAK